MAQDPDQTGNQSELTDNQREILFKNAANDLRSLLGKRVQTEDGLKTYAELGMSGDGIRSAMLLGDTHAIITHLQEGHNNKTLSTKLENVYTAAVAFENATAEGQDTFEMMPVFRQALIDAGFTSKEMVNPKTGKPVEAVQPDEFSVTLNHIDPEVQRKHAETISSIVGFKISPLNSSVNGSEAFKIEIPADRIDSVINGLSAIRQDPKFAYDGVSLTTDSNKNVVLLLGNDPQKALEAIQAHAVDFQHAPTAALPVNLNNTSTPSVSRAVRSRATPHLTPAENNLKAKGDSTPLAIEIPTGSEPTVRPLAPRTATAATAVPAKLEIIFPTLEQVHRDVPAMPVGINTPQMTELEKKIHERNAAIMGSSLKAEEKEKLIITQPQIENIKHYAERHKSENWAHDWAKAEVNRIDKDIAIFQSHKGDISEAVMVQLFNSHLKTIGDTQMVDAQGKPVKTLAFEQDVKNGKRPDTSKGIDNGSLLEKIHAASKQGNGALQQLVDTFTKGTGHDVSIDDITAPFTAGVSPESGKVRGQ